ncbi:MAG: hypothetical protein Kow0092_11200 [Deferrisomatales bacterium]
MRAAAAAAAGLALFAGLAGGARADTVRLEAHGGALVVTATVNDRLSGRFLLDTGASYCVLSRGAARQARIRQRTGGPTVRLRTAGGEIEATVGEARKVEVGGAVARKVSVAVVDGEPVPGLAGVIGLSFLERFRYTVDAQEGTLELRR